MIKNNISIFLATLALGLTLIGAVGAQASDLSSTSPTISSQKACQKAEQATHTANIDAAHKTYKAALVAIQSVYKAEKAAKNPDAKKHFMVSKKTAQTALNKAIKDENARNKAAIAACKAAPKKTPDIAPATTAPENPLVNLSHFSFQPNTLTVTVGTAVQWKQLDDAPHQIALDDGSFTSPVLNSGDVVTHSFGSAGTFPYHCVIHPDMKGTIIVK